MTSLRDLTWEGPASSGSAERLRRQVPDTLVPRAGVPLRAVDIAKVLASLKAQGVEL